MYESDDKMVSHPAHYQGANGMEVIEVIEAFTAELKGIEATDTGNVIKYILRWKQKNGIQDLEKCIWYTTHLIEYLKNKQMLDEEEFSQYMNKPESDEEDITCLTAFNVLFPLYSARLYKWVMINEYTAKINIKDDEEEMIFAFTYYSPGKWVFEPFENYISRMMKDGSSN